MDKKLYSIRPGFRLDVSDPTAPDGLAHKFHGDFVMLDDEAAEQYRDAIRPVPPPEEDADALAAAPAIAEDAADASDQASQ